MPARKRVLVAPSVLATRQAAYFTRLEAAGFEVIRSPLGRTHTESELIEALRGVFATVAGGEPYTDRVFREAPALEVVARFGVGYERIDVEAASRHGVMIAMAFGGNHEAVADFAFTLMGAVTRDVVRYDRRVRAGDWSWEFRPGLWRSTVGIVGLGRIGKAVARRCRGFEMRVLAYDPVPDEAFAQAHAVSLVPMETLLREADFVTLHAPHSRETDRLINARTLALMKPTAFVINTARGGLVDEVALHDALASGRLAGAGLDVFRDEPPAGSPLLALDNVVVAPHLAGADLAAEAATGHRCAEAIIAVARGGQPGPESLLNPDAIPNRRRSRGEAAGGAGRSGSRPDEPAAAGA